MTAMIEAACGCAYCIYNFTMDGLEEYLGTTCSYEDAWKFIYKTFIYDY